MGQGRMTDQNVAANERHSVPVIDRMMEILEQIEQHSDGLSITDLTANLAMPRTSIYRVLNTLQRHEIVRRGTNGRYVLGPRLLRLASSLANSTSDLELQRLAQPIMDQLASKLGEGVKLSVLDEHGVTVVAVAQGRREYALTVSPGQSLPIPVGAASKVLLGNLPRSARLARLSNITLKAFTSATITDVESLKAELEKIADQGWASDLGEQASSIHAIAAPVMNSKGIAVAALSVPFLAGSEEDRVIRIKEAVIDAAHQISLALAQ